MYILLNYILRMTSMRVIYNKYSYILKKIIVICYKLYDIYYLKWNKQ